MAFAASLYCFSFTKVSSFSIPVINIINFVKEEIVTVILFLALSKFLISLQISFTVVSFVSVFCFILEIN